jgi:hypothetical protein
MANIVRSVRLNNYSGSDLDVVTYSNGEIVFDATNNTLRLMDGSTQGGRKLATQSWIASNVTPLSIQRIVTIADGTTITMNASTTDVAIQTNTQSIGTLTIAAPTGIPADGQRLTLRLKSSSVQTFSWNAIFAGSNDVPLPTQSSGSNKFDYIGFIYNSSAVKWHLVAKTFGF